MHRRWPLLRERPATVRRQLPFLYFESRIYKGRASEVVRTRRARGRLASSCNRPLASAYCSSIHRKLRARELVVLYLKMFRGCVQNQLPGRSGIPAGAHPGRSTLVRATRPPQPDLPATTPTTAGAARRQHRGSSDSRSALEHNESHCSQRDGGDRAPAAGWGRTEE